MAVLGQLAALGIDAPFYQAGLAGYSDSAMRRIARMHGCPYCITEAMLDVFLVNGGKGLRDAALVDGDRPICGQLMGSAPEAVAAGARVLFDLGYDVVDVNLACPVKKVKKKARGGHLLSAPDEAVAILEAVAEAVGGDVPLTVKLRRAYDDTPAADAAFERVFRATMELGYAGATVHCRTVQQKYIGPGRRAFLRELMERHGEEARQRGFTVGGSGDIWAPQDVLDMLDQTGVHWVSVARGCIGNPWFFQQTRALLAGEPAVAPTLGQQREVLLQHFDFAVEQHGEQRAGRTMRKFGIKFAEQHHPDGAAAKKAFIGVRDTESWREAVEAWYPADDFMTVA